MINVMKAIRNSLGKKCMYTNHSGTFKAKNKGLKYVLQIN